MAQRTQRIISIIGWIGTVLVFGAVAVRFLKPDWDRYAIWGAWAGLVLVLVYTLGQWRDIVRLFARRQARYGTLAATGVLIVLGILIAINYLAGRQNKRWDLTAGGQFTLSDQTKKILQGLDAPLKMIVFAQETEFSRFRDKLPEYGYVSKQVQIEYVDADKQPARAKQYQVQSYGTVVLDHKGRTERVVSDQEQEIVNGIIKVVTGKARKVYVVQGHGEHDTAASDRTGYSSAASALRSDNFEVDKIVLAQQKDVPEDASVVIIAGPRTDYFAPEIDALRRYLRKGGKLLVMIDPPDKPGATPMPNLTGLLDEWGIEMGNNIVVDISGMGRLLGAGPEVPLVASYPSHPITQQFNVLTAFPLARSMSPKTGVTGKSPQTFAETGPQSWAETDIQRLLTSREVEMNTDKGDKQGPVSIAVAVTGEAPDAKAPDG
ncbi:MAG: GldG family protein, partial [Acidobacteria bacterium]|nr:GldG family protein [Acidobacteriota bacterium]